MREPARGLPRVGSRFGLAKAGRAFRHRNYRLFFGGQLVSLVGTWMQQVAQAWLVLELTGEPFYLGVVTALAFLPVLILGLFGGVIADALPKRQTLMVTQTIQMALAFILFALVFTHSVQLWHVFLLSALLGITNAVDMPTRQGFTVEMVGREDVANAVALNSAIFNTARIVGPAIAGLTIGAFGGNLSPAFLINGFSFLAVIVAYRAMRQADLNHSGVYTRPQSFREVRSNVADGLRFVRRSELVALATITVGLASTFGMNFGVVIPALAYDVLRIDATGYGFLMTATGVGSLTAALGIAFSGRARPVLMPLGATILGIALLLTSFVHSFGIALLTMVFVGGGAIAMAATANTCIQLTVPDHLRGRVISVYTTVFVGTTPLGGLLTGAVASAYGTDAAIAVGGIGSIATGLMAFLWLRRVQARRGLPLAEPLPQQGAVVGRDATGAATPDDTGLVRAR